MNANPLSSMLLVLPLVLLQPLGCTFSGGEPGAIDDPYDAGAGALAEVEGPSDRDPDRDADPEPDVSLDSADTDAQTGGDVSTVEAPRTVLLLPGTLIPGKLFNTMAARLKDDGFRPVVYVPPDMFTESLITGAARISAEVDRIRAETGEARIHIVAECDGGVATRYYTHVLGGHAVVDQVVTFVSAHNGTKTSPLGYWATGFQALADIRPGSPFLAELDATPFPEGLSFTSIYSCWDELLWPFDTSVIEGATNVLFCDHYIGHFDGFWDLTVYGRIRQALDGETRSAPTSY